MDDLAYRYRETRAAPGRPLIVTFHGTGGDENQFFGLGTDLVPGAGILSPRGDVSEFGAARFFKRKAEGVYDMDDLRVRTAKMAAFLKAKIAEAEPSRIIGLGYSNGANLLASVVFAEPRIFDDVILMHPLVTWEPDATPGLAGRRVLLTAGRHDPICPPDRTLALETFFRREGAAVRTEWHEGGHEVRQAELAAIQQFLG